MPATKDKAIPGRVQRRVWTRIFRAHPSVCWYSTWSRGSHGRPQIGWYRGDGSSDMVTAARAVWVSVNGPIPAGRDLTVDHVCHNAECLNPAHLRLLSNRDNAADNAMARRTHCPSGHEYDETNTYRNPNTGHRFCRTCQRAAKRAA